MQYWSRLFHYSQSQGISVYSQLELKGTLFFSIKPSILSSVRILNKFSKSSMFESQNFTNSNLNLKYDKCSQNHSISNFLYTDFGESERSFLSLTFVASFIYMVFITDCFFYIYGVHHGLLLLYIWYSPHSVQTL